MITQPLEAQPGQSAVPLWTARQLGDRIREIAFTPGTTLDLELFEEIASFLLAENQVGGIRAVVHVSGLVDVCPGVATRVSAARTSTRLALLGQSRVDRVLAGFMMADLTNAGLAAYVTDMDEALAYLADPEH